MYRSRPRSRAATHCLIRPLAFAILASIVAAPALAQQAPTYSLHVLLKPTPEEPDAQAFVQTFGASRALREDLGDPLSVLPSISLPQLPPELAGALDPESSDAQLRRWVTLTYNAATAKSAADVKQVLRETKLFDVIDEEPAYSFSYAVNDELYTTTNPNTNKRQWALSALQLPQAFDWTRGRVLIGAVDGGVPGFFNENGTPVSGYPTHPDIEPNVRRHLSYTMPKTNTDPAYGCDTPAKLGYGYSSFLTTFGHGTHVTGIMAALANNSAAGGSGTLGVSGSCPTCSFIMMQASPTESGCVTAGAVFAAHNGASVLNFSLGRSAPSCASPTGGIYLSCAAIDDLAKRDVALIAAAGNSRVNQVQFPASDDRVIGVGAIDDQKRLWNEANAFTYPHEGTAPGSTRCPGTTLDEGCGSNFGSGLDLVAPGAQIVSTITSNYIPFGNVPPCAVDSALNSQGYGPCTGTSMASPYVAGIAGLIRSVNPLLSWQDTKTALAAGATITPGYTATQMGAGYPNAETAVKKTLGVVGGKTVFNRLTPLFSQVDCQPSPQFICAEKLSAGQGIASWLFTSSPQTAIAAAKAELYYVEDMSVVIGGSAPPNLAGTRQSVAYFPSYRLGSGIGKSVSDAYAFRNGVLGPDANGGGMQPGASAYVFTGNRDPKTGNEVAPNGTSYLVPLVRMSSKCSNFRKHTYVVDQGDTAGSPGTRQFFEQSAVVACDASTNVTGYNTDVVEGYIFRAHAPNGSGELPQPPGTQKLYRHYNPTTKAWILVLESELGLEAPGGLLAGYSAPSTATYGDPLLGYVYPNVDSDEDGLVDGFELTVGTDPDTDDSDCDGQLDKAEFPLGALPVSDPADGPNCAVRALSILLNDDE